MPVNWDAQKDQFLLLQIIADKSINISKAHYDNILAAWPKQLGEKPTQRAITEHFVKLRKSLEKGGVTAPSPANKSAGSKSASTKGRSPKTPGSKKRKAGDDSDDSEGTMISGPKREYPETSGDHATQDGQSPTTGRTKLPRESKSPAKRARVQEYIAKHFNDDTDGEDDNESDVHPAAENASAPAAESQ